MPNLPRLGIALIVTGLLLAGCADKTATRANTGSSPTTSSRPAASSTNSTGSAKATRSSHGTAGSTAAAKADLDDGTETTGIAACDDYLSSYMACHKAANVFAPSQLPDRYKAMRESLLRDSKNPEVRPQLAARCNSLATQLREALHGKSCTPDSTQP